jgi:hypothetical protein
MTAETAPGQARTARGPAGPGTAGNGQPPGLSDRTVRYGIWLAVAIRILGDRRFQATVITGAIGMYALASLMKKNQARAMRRAIRWYNREANRLTSRQGPAQHVLPS